MTCSTVVLKQIKKGGETMTRRIFFVATLFLVGALLTLSGCLVGRGYRQPSNDNYYSQPTRNDNYYSQPIRDNNYRPQPPKPAKPPKKPANPPNPPTGDYNPPQPHQPPPNQDYHGAE